MQCRVKIDKILRNLCLKPIHLITDVGPWMLLIDSLHHHLWVIPPQTAHCSLNMHELFDLFLSRLVIGWDLLRLYEQSSVRRDMIGYSQSCTIYEKRVEIASDNLRRTIYINFMKEHID